MKRRVAKELRAFSRQALGPAPPPPRRGRLRRLWDWLRGVEDPKPIDFERRAYRNVKRQYKRWRRQVATG